MRVVEIALQYGFESQAAFTRAFKQYFGIHDFFGLKYLQYKLFSDLAHMSKEEILPWEFWGVGYRAAYEKMIDGD